VSGGVGGVFKRAVRSSLAWAVKRLVVRLYGGYYPSQFHDEIPSKIKEPERKKA